MSGDPGANLQDWIRRLNAIATLPERAAPEIAKAIDASLRANIAAGTDPDGNAWQPTKTGQQPLRNAGRALTVTTLGTRIIARLTGPEALHHLGKARGHAVRRILPTRKLNAPVIAAIKSALQRAHDESFK